MIAPVKSGEIRDKTLLGVNSQDQRNKFEFYFCFFIGKS